MLKLIATALVVLGLGAGGFSLYSDFQTKRISQPTVAPATPVSSITPPSSTSLPQIKTILITENDNGKSYTFTLATRASLRLSNKYIWKFPQVTGQAIELVQVNYFQDPGFQEWEIVPVKAGTASITSSGTPDMQFEITISVSTDSVVTSDLVLKGTFIIVYGDPPDGGTARYYYSVTDSQGKTTKLIFTNNSKYIDGESLINYDRKQVKILGKSSQDKSTIEVLTIELD